MEMTIDESITQLSMQKFYVLGKDYEAVQVAIDTMRKYQQIQEIYLKWNRSYETSTSSAWTEVIEVIENERKDREVK